MGIASIISEALDEIVDNPWKYTFIALVSFYVGLEISGYGFLWHATHRWRIKKLNQDLERVRELQQQIAVLRGIQASRLSAKKAVLKTTNGEAFATEPALTDERSERSRKVRFGKQRKIDISGLARLHSTSETTGHVPTVGEDAIKNNKNHNQSKETIANSSRSSFDGAASNVYEAVKDTWTWGRHRTPFSSVLGIVEGVTSSAANVFGTDMKGLDDTLKSSIAAVDERVVTPAVHTIQRLLFGASQNDDIEKYYFEK